MSRGFAFVDFGDVNIAREWLEVNKESITIDGSHVRLEYYKESKTEKDWVCSKVRDVVR